MSYTLTIDGQSLDIDGAWGHNRSLRRLRSTIATRGDNQAVEGVPGTTAYGVIRHETVVDLELKVYGINDRLGAAHPDLLTGVDENLAYLDDWVADHTTGSPATYAASLLTSGGTTYTANVQILNWQVAQENAVQVVMSYDLRVPSGIWVPV